MAFYDPISDVLPWREVLELEKLSSSAYQSQLDKFKCTVDTTQVLLLDVMSQQAKAELPVSARLWIQELKDDFCDAVGKYEKFVSLAVGRIRKSLRAIASRYRHTAHMMFDSVDAFNRVVDNFQEFLNLSSQKIRETLDAINIIHCLFGFLLDYKYTHWTRAETCSCMCAQDVIQKKNDHLPEGIVDQKMIGSISSSSLAPNARGHVSCFQSGVILSRSVGSKAFLKWVFVVLNMVAEVCQAVLTQEAAEGKLRRKIFLQLSIITSFVCLIMALLEALHEARGNKVLWRKQGRCCWFYYPGAQGRLFGRFSLYFGIICSTAQLGINLITKFTNRTFIRFDYVPLLFSVCLMVAAMIGSQEKTVEKVYCKTHGYNAAETMLVDGHGWVIECRNCKVEKSV